MAKEKQIKITQVRSLIGRNAQQRATIRALGLRRLNHFVVQKDTPQVRGMLNMVAHLVRYEEL